MKKAFQAQHEMEIKRFLFESEYLHHESGQTFMIELPMVLEPVPFEMLVDALAPQFESRRKCERFVDQMMEELRRQQLSDAIASMIKV